MHLLVRFKTFLPLSFLLFLPSLLNAQPVRGVAGDLWADLVLGQTDQAPDGSGVFILNSAFGERKPNQANAGTIFYAGGVFVDRSGGAGNERFYVWDSNNSRVLGFTNPSAFSPNPSVTQFGFHADMVLGQPDFSHCACNGDNNYQNYANNYPYDLTPPNASQLCGEGDAQQSTSEGGSRSNMAADSQGNLYVPDPGNNRVLRFERTALVSGAMGPAASAVWGQASFTGYLPNQGFTAPNNASLNFGTVGYGGEGGCAVDSQGNLWVADPGNNRVLRFPNPNAPNPGVPSKTADLVLGQPDFNSTTTANDLSHVYGPLGVRVDKAGNVFVTDAYGRILAFPPSAYLSGGNPVNGGTASFAMTNFIVGPTALEIGNDDTGSGVESLWEADTSADQLVMFGVNCPAMTYTPQKLLLENQLKSTASNNTNATGGDGAVFNYVYPPGSSTQLYATSGPAGIGVDNSGNVFMCYINGNNGVWRFPNTVSNPIPNVTYNGSSYVANLPAGEAHSADVDVFKQSQYGINNTFGPANVGLVGQGGSGVAVAQNMPTPQIVVSDTYRLMYWNLPAAGPQALGNGAVPTGYAGVDQQATPSLVYNEGPTIFGRMKVDQATSPQHLWVGAVNKAGISSVVEVYNLPLSGNALPALVIGTNIPILGSSPVSYLDWTNGEAGEGGQAGLSSLAPSWDGAVSYLWADDEGHGRVFRIRDPLGSLHTCNGAAGPCVDIVIGQKDASNNDCSEQGQLDASKNCNGEKSPVDKYCLSKPGAVNLDHKGNLFVSDSFLETTGNARLLEYDVSTIQNNGASCTFGTGGTGIGATRVYDRGGDYTQTGATCSPGGPCIIYPFDAAFPSDDHMMVVGSFQGTNFPVVVPAPLSDTDPGNPQYPWATLKDYSSAVYSLTFDKQDNLYTTDLDRSRVLVYLQPFPTFTPTPPGTLTPVNTPTFTPSPTPNCFQGGGNLPTPPGGFPNGAYAMATDMGHKLIYLGYGNSAGTPLIAVYSYTTQGVSPTYLTTITGITFSDILDMAVDDQGNIYVTEFNNALVQKILYNGGAYAPGTTFGPSDSIGNPRGIYVCPNGNTVYVSTESGVVYRYDSANCGSTYQLTAHFGTATQLGIPTGVLKIGNTIYVVATTLDEVVYYVETPGTPPTYSAGANVDLGAGNVPVLLDPFFIKKDLAGNIYVTSTADYYLLVFSPVTSTTFDLLYNPQFPTPYDVTVDQFDDVYVSRNNPTSSVVEVRGCFTEPTLTPTGGFPCGSATATQTPTLTPTATPTPTLPTTPTNTLTVTASSTPTNSPTPTATLTPTSSPTVTLTFSPTSSPTMTPTATASFTPTSTPTVTLTSTPTSTATEGCHEPVPYPNPCRGDQFTLHLSPCDQGREVHIKIFTVVSRKVLDKDIQQVPIGTDLTLELKDNWGRPLANGLYYLVLDRPEGRTIGKLLILR